MTIAQPATEQQKRGIKKTIIAAVIIIAVFFSLFLNKMLSPRVMSAAELRTNGAILFERPRVIEAFTLLDHQGKPFTLEQLKGRWSYVFFGFTHCPDICPNTLSKLSQVYSQLAADTRENLQVIMVSVDPARDTPQKLGEYIPFFNPNFIGLTGEFLEIMKLTQNLNAAFNKVPMGDSYTIDHTANVIVINPKGHYHGFLKPPLELAKAKAIMHSIPEHMAERY
ncbi:MAG: SCO family protein [Cellvibrionaceae bacterium]|nr:SCO family protein [Cellvibrionaceae bacterium]